MPKKFIPYHQLNHQKAIVVDGVYKNGLVLSHWKGANIIPEISDDTSAGIVLNAIEKNYLGIETETVSATHFDIDGFVGVWTLFNPELALQHKDILKELALIGDFREVSDINSPVSLHALKLACWLNKLEADLYYKPFGYLNKGLNEMEACAEKFNYFLPRFSDVLLQTDKYKTDWQDEFDKVLSDIRSLETAEIKQIEHLGITIVKTPKPLHYYALFYPSKGADIVVSIYSNNRYEVEMKYTTWVDIVSRAVLPRINMNKLAVKLNTLECSGKIWHTNHYSDTGPILSLNNTENDKESRFENPYLRNIHSSNISPEQFEEVVLEFFTQKYASIQPKNFWTWDEINS